MKHLEGNEGYKPVWKAMKLTEVLADWGIVGTENKRVRQCQKIEGKASFLSIKNLQTKFYAAGTRICEENEWLGKYI